MSLPDIVAAAFWLYVRHPAAFLVLSLPAGLLSLGAALLSTHLLNAAGAHSLISDSSSQTVSSATALGAVAAAAVGLTLILLFSFFADGFIVPAVLQAQRGERPDLRRTLRCWIAFAPASFVASAILAAPLAIALISFILALFALVSYVRVSLIIQVFAAEGAGPLRAISRSRALVRGMWWRAAYVTVGIAALAEAPAIVMQRALAPSRSDVSEMTAIFLFAWLTAPFAAAARTLLYLDLRRRKGERDGPAAPVTA